MQTPWRNRIGGLFLMTTCNSFLLHRALCVPIATGLYLHRDPPSRIKCGCKVHNESQRTGSCYKALFDRSLEFPLTPVNFRRSSFLNIFII